MKTKLGLMVLGAMALSLVETAAVAADFKMPKTKLTMETYM